MEAYTSNVSEGRHALSNLNDFQRHQLNAVFDLPPTATIWELERSICHDTERQTIDTNVILANRVIEYLNDDWSADYDNLFIEIIYQQGLEPLPGDLSIEQLEAILEFLKFKVRNPDREASNYREWLAMSIRYRIDDLTPPPFVIMEGEEW
jgi:hypothetical protein